MSQSQDTEITLGTGKMLFLFFGLVALCSVFFAVGYRLGRGATSSSGSGDQTTAVAATNGGPRPSAVKSPSSQTPDLTFYKSVGQEKAEAQLTSSKDANTTEAADPAQTETPPSPSGGYFVQVAAVSKLEDAEALVDALKKKQYSASGSLQTDKLYHVQIGPFGDIKEAEGTRAKLVGDGYNPILKK
jgi:DedD protein